MITLILILLMIITMSITPSTEQYPVPYYTETGAYLVQCDKIICKDGYQYEVDYSDGSHESYFQCADTWEEFERELNNSNE